MIRPINDYGFVDDATVAFSKSAVTDEDEVSVSSQHHPTDEAERLLDEIDQLISPLLRRLQDDPKSLTIKWPDRAMQMAELEEEFSQRVADLRQLLSSQ